jgi:hypothetical protein
MRSIACAACLITALFWSRPAHADLITIEPDDFAAGTNLTAVTPGALLWSALITGTPGDPLHLSAVYAVHSSVCDDGNLFTTCYAATGTQGFSPYSNAEGSLFTWSSDRHPAQCLAVLNGASSGPNTCSSLYAGFRALLIELTDPTSFVQVAGGWNSDYVELRALDENFHMLTLSQTLIVDPRLPGYATTGTVSMTAPTATMKYIFAGSTEGGIALDQVQFASVPEPSTLLLAFAGFVGLSTQLHRRTR